MIAAEAAPSAELVAVLKLACLAAFGWHCAALLRGRRLAPSALALAAATGLVWTVLLVMVLYKVVTMMPLNFAMVVLALDDAAKTLVHVLGEHGVALALGTLAALAAAAGTAAGWLLRALRGPAARFAPGTRGAVACIGVLCYLVAADVWYAARELVFFPRWQLLARSGHSIPGPRVPDYSGIAVGANESVFIVQLESVSAFALFERTADGADWRARIRQPGLEAILGEGGGVFFPLFWANAMQTNRAWESILCAVSGNLGPAIAGDPARLARRTCLPAHLARAGYSTVWLYSYFDLEFFNLRSFARMAGFQDVAYGTRLMAEGDRRHDWAYDDCVFYERAFDYLAQQGLDKRERLFAYFEVGMHHSPFIHSRKYPEAHPYREPADLLEHYLNSSAEQDHCLAVFWKRFRALGRDDVHLFIVPDHSLWVHGALRLPDATFATWMAYVPPRRRAAEFKPRRVLAPVPSQAQLYATVLELLGGAARPESFAFALRGEPTPQRYDDCHTLSEPFYQRQIVRRAGERAEFRLPTGELVRSDAPTEKVDFWIFQERFACRQ